MQAFFSQVLFRYDRTVSETFFPVLSEATWNSFIIHIINKIYIHYKYKNLMYFYGTSLLHQLEGFFQTNYYAKANISVWKKKNCTYQRSA